MKVNTFAKVVTGLTASALALCAFATPASADPTTGTFGTLVGLGSDTTQDVLNGLATAIGSNKLASYDALGSGTVTPRPGKTLPRANGSSAGRDLLRVAIGQTETANVATSGASVPVTTKDVAGLIDFARSSSGLSAADARADGVLTYVPFGIDAVSYATSPTSVIPTDLTTAQLTAIYKGQIDRVAVSGSTRTLLNKSDAAPSGAEIVPITTFIPQDGSGTRSYWLGKVAITSADIAAGTYPNLKAVDLAGAPVQEHKGAALITGTATQQKGTIVPFSIGQWIAQANKKVPTDHRAGALINSVGGQSATLGSGTAYSLNPAFTAYTRTVYNIVPSVLVDDESSAISAAFVGQNSLVCKQTSTIEAFGFGLLTGATKCGDTSVRGYAASTSSVTVDEVAAAKAGKATTLSANVTSFGNGGGKVLFTTAGSTTPVATAVVASGATKGSVAWTPAAAGAVELTATFVPTLAGVAASQAAPLALTVAPADAVTPVAAATTTKVAVSGSKVVGASYTLTATVSAATAAAGKVTFSDGSKALGSADVVAGKAAIKVKASKTAYSVTAVFTPTNSANFKASTSAALKVAVAKATASVKVAAPAKAKAKSKVKVVITVTAAGAPITGKVTLVDGKKTVKTVTLKSGKATVYLTKVKAGSHKLTATYKGSTLVKSAKATKTVKVSKK